MPVRPYHYVKRTFDVFASLTALLCLAPVAAVISALVKFDSRGPVFYRQTRLGRNGVPFTLYKFRTMRDGAAPIYNEDGSLHTSDSDPRLTRFGRFLREFSLDELPQLVNVLRGEMSLVGPRPDPVDVLARYDGLLRRKLLVLPGLTNLPAVSGRNRLSWRRRAELDSYYIDHLSLGLDLKILLKTVAVVISREGVYSAQPPSREGMR